VPLPLLVLLCKIIQGSCDIREFGNKGTVEVAEPKETSNTFGSGWYWPLGDSLYFDGVHSYFSIANYQSKVVNFSFMESAFLWLQKEVISRILLKM
jgi:hypothetical protein